MAHDTNDNFPPICGPGGDGSLESLIRKGVISPYDLPADMLPATGDGSMLDPRHRVKDDEQEGTEAEQVEAFLHLFSPYAGTLFENELFGGSVLTSLYEEEPGDEPGEDPPESADAAFDRIIKEMFPNATIITCTHDGTAEALDRAVLSYLGEEDEQDSGAAGSGYNLDPGGIIIDVEWHEVEDDGDEQPDPAVNWDQVLFTDIDITCEQADDDLFYPVAWYQDRGYALTGGYEYESTARSLVYVYRENPQVVYMRLRELFPNGRPAGANVWVMPPFMQLTNMGLLDSSLRPVKRQPEPVNMNNYPPPRWFPSDPHTSAETYWESFVEFCVLTGLDPYKNLPSRRTHILNHVRAFLNTGLPYFLKKTRLMRKIGRWVTLHAPHERCLVCGKVGYGEVGGCDMFNCPGGFLTF